LSAVGLESQTSWPSAIDEPNSQTHAVFAT